MTTTRSLSPEAPRFKSTTSAASNYADFVSIPQFGVTRGILNEYIARDDLEKERAKKEEQLQYQRSRDALMDSRYEADRQERLADKFDSKQKESMTNEALALIGNKDAFLSGKISAENKAYADALAQISDPSERARLEQDIKGYQAGQQRQSWIDTTLGQSNIENSKVLDLKRDIEKEEENKRRFELGYDMQKEQLAQSRADSAYNRELNNKKLQLEMAKLNTKDLSAMEKDLATFQKIYGIEEGQKAFDKKYNPDGKTGSGKNELPTSVVDMVINSQKSIWSLSGSEQESSAELLKGLKSIKSGLNLSDESLTNFTKVALGESGITGAGNVNEKALESFFGKDLIVDQNNNVVPVGNAVKEILNNPDRFSIVNSGGKPHFIDLETPTGKILNDKAFGAKDEKSQPSSASENKGLGSIKGPVYGSEGSKNIPIPGSPVDPTKSGAQQIGEGIYKGATGAVKDIFAPAIDGVSKALDSNTYTKAAVSVANALASSANEVAFSPITASKAFTEWLITGKADESSISSEADYARKLAVQSLRKMGVEQPTNSQIKNVLDNAASIK